MKLRWWAAHLGLGAALSACAGQPPEAESAPTLIAASSESRVALGIDSWTVESTGDSAARTVIMRGADQSGETLDALQVDVTASPPTVLITVSGTRRSAVRLATIASGEVIEEGLASFRANDEARRIVERASADLRAAESGDRAATTASVRPLNSLVAGGAPLTHSFQSFGHCVSHFGQVDATPSEIQALCIQIMYGGTPP